MNDQELTSKSKFLSLVLRHDPGCIGLELDREGWADVDELLDKATAAGKTLNREIVEGVMGLPGKKRFEFSDDGRRIRAMQGHSAREVMIVYEAVVPPETLFHGTATRFVDSIREKGLLPGDRHLVHLSPDRETAVEVGRRHGKPVVLEVAAGAMHRAGREFHQAANGVWLVKAVPAEYLTFPGA